MYSSTKDKVLKEWSSFGDDINLIKGPLSLKKIRLFLESIFIDAPTLFLGSIVDKVKYRKRFHYNSTHDVPLDHILEVLGFDLGPHPDNQTLEIICEDVGKNLHEDMGLEVDFAGLIYHFYGEISDNSKKSHWNGYQKNTAFRFVPKDYNRNIFEGWEYQNGRVYIPIKLFVPLENIGTKAIIESGGVEKASEDTYYGGMIQVFNPKGKGGFMTVCISPGGAKIGPLVYGERIHLDERKDLQLPKDNPTYLVFNMPHTMRNLKDTIISKFQNSYMARNRIQVKTI